MSTPAADLMQRLGLSDDELCEILAADPISVLTAQLDHRPELGILLDLLAEATERAGATMLHRWVRATGPHGRPVDLLTARDFAQFEDAVDDLAANGFVLRLR
jgi:hypothetical protein